MVARGLRLFAFALPLAAALLTGCEDDAKLNEDMSAAQDIGVFIPCDPKQGTQTNPACPAKLPQCHPAAQICVGCIPSSQTCLPGFVCSQDSMVCMPIDPNAACTRSVDCPKRIDGSNPRAIICDVSDGKCYECVKHEDCVDPVSGGIGYCEPTLRKCMAQPDGGV